MLLCNKSRGIGVLVRSMGSMAHSDVFYVRQSGAESRLRLSFTYREPELNFQRVFNMDRCPTESAGVLASRIAANVERCLAKRVKKRMRSGSLAIDQLIFRPPVWILLDSVDVSPDVSCADILVGMSERVCIKVGQTQYTVSLNPPTVQELKLPSCVMVGFPVYASCVVLDHASERDSKLLWQRSVPSLDKKGRPSSAGAPNTWIDVGEGAVYHTSVDDLGCYLRLVYTPQMGDLQGLPFTADTGLVEAAPGVCPFELRHAFTPTPLPPEDVRVVTYNILADLYADSDFTRTVLHPYCPPYALNIDYRKQLILKELSGFHADIICLQEVDSKVFDRDLVPMLGACGQDGFHTLKGGQVSEGLACFWRRDKFHLIDSDRMVISEAIFEDALFADIAEMCDGNDQLKTRLAKRSQVLQVCVLMSVTPETPVRRLVVANTHLYFHPDADHIRALQIGVCMRHLERLLQRLRADDSSSNVDLIFCGDFNSCPDFSVYRLMTTRELPADLTDFSSNADEQVRGISFRHSMPMASACGCPDYTNHVSSFKGCLDYIFYQTDRLQVKQVVPLPSDEEVTQHTALPSVVFPSDHLSLVADLSWRSAES